ncbi:DNA alkylation repair protein [Georgenia yuyongxinii]|uniref:DNA alkylation repair protein n=1 Tax=Georgenia yuyongxinii TaxID=2589797 RepID=A0A5B8C2Z0_9MICO|nr:DNA alkylation repair protein [Georgenia yuyongxinii]QDC25049.1 DNA alkylation repair protein [Georgenia yuyongxinii]
MPPPPAPDPGQDLRTAIRGALAAAADPERAAGQQRYMKSAMPFRGLTSPVLKATLRPLLADPALALPDRSTWEAAIRDLWDGAEFREERYAAIALARHRRYAGWAAEPAALHMYRHLVETGAWWDLVDDVAAHLVGAVLRAHPAEGGAHMRTWAVDDHLWVRRTAILSQLKSKAGTDTDLLADCIGANLAGSRHGHEFFIRKAIGWALREYAKTDAAWVRAYVEAAGSTLAPLSRREALEHLG